VCVRGSMLNQARRGLSRLCVQKLSFSGSKVLMSSLMILGGFCVNSDLELGLWFQAEVPMSPIQVEYVQSSKMSMDSQKLSILENRNQKPN
jgi:hypothetical protein